MAIYTTPCWAKSCAACCSLLKYALHWVNSPVLCYIDLSPCYQEATIEPGISAVHNAQEATTGHETLTPAAQNAQEATTSHKALIQAIPTTPGCEATRPIHSGWSWNATTTQNSGKLPRSLTWLLHTRTPVPAIKADWKSWPCSHTKCSQRPAGAAVPSTPKLLVA